MKKKTFLITLSLITILGLSSCIKQLEKTFNGNRVAEIDAAVVNSKAAGVTYPIITRVPAMGRQLTTGCPDSVLRRFSGNIRVRVNLVGPQSEKDETVGFSTFESPISTISFPATIAASSTLGCATAQSPSRASASSLAVSSAVMGTHYNITNATSGKITIPANSSYGYIDIALLNGTATTGGRFIGIKLDSTGTILPSVNYSMLGIVVDQR